MEVLPKTRERSRSRDADDMGSSLFLVVSNLPYEATEDEIIKFMHTLRIENLVINDGVATLKV